MFKFIVIPALILVFVGGGAINLSHAVRYRTPPVTTLKETPASSLPTFVTLKDVAFDIDHLLKLKFGSEVLYVPLRAKDAPDQSEYPVIVQMSAAELIAAVGSKSPDALKYLAALAARTEVTGRVCSVDARQLDNIRKEVPNVSKQVVLIDDGATPGTIQGIVMLVIGLGLTVIVVAGGFKKVAREQSSTLAKA
jgi:hypothetical protein